MPTYEAQAEGESVTHRGGGIEWCFKQGAGTVSF